MGEKLEQRNRAMLRVRDTIDREYATELNLAALAQLAHISTAHLISPNRRPLRVGTLCE